MSIFESKGQVFWRKIREVLGRFFGRIGAWFGRMGSEFRALSRGGKTAILSGAAVIVLLFVFVFAIWPRLSRPAAEPAGPPPESVASAIERISDDLQRPITEEEVPTIIAEIDHEVEQTQNKGELLSLYSLRAQTFFNAGQFYEAADAYKVILDRDLVSDGKYFEVYSGLYYSYTLIGDAEAAKPYAALIVEQYTNGNKFDDGGCPSYARAAGIDANTCPSMAMMNQSQQ